MTAQSPHLPEPSRFHITNLAQLFSLYERFEQRVCALITELGISAGDAHDLFFQAVVDYWLFTDIGIATWDAEACLKVYALKDAGAMLRRQEVITRYWWYQPLAIAGKPRYLNGQRLGDAIALLNKEIASGPHRFRLLVNLHFREGSGLEVFARASRLTDSQATDFRTLFIFLLDLLRNHYQPG